MFVAAGLGFVGRALAQGVNDGALDDLQGGWVALAVIAAALAMTFIATRWTAAVRLVGGDLPMARAVPLYFQGEIGKYVPGGLWAVLGRGELATREGLSRSAAYASVALSLAGLYLAAALVAAVLLPFAAGARGTVAVLGVLGFLVIGVLALHPAVVGRVVALGERVARRPLDLTIPAWGDTIGFVAAYVPAWISIGVVHWCSARALGGTAPVTHIAFAAAVSWAAGFLAIPAPGGIGVRETVFVLTSGLAAHDAAAAAVVARLLFIVTDGLGAAMGALWTSRRRR